MDFASGGTEKAPAFKSIAEDEQFETELEKRQQEWEKAKTSEVESNEGLPIDRRPLWMKLQEQKDKKQADWDEKHDPKAMVQGLEEDEAEFLNKVFDYQERVKSKQKLEEMREMRMYREAAMQSSHADADAQMLDSVLHSAVSQAKKKQAKSPAALMAGMVKTKRKRSSDGEPPSKAPRVSLDGETKDCTATETRTAVTPARAVTSPTTKDSSSQLKANTIDRDVKSSSKSPTAAGDKNPAIGLMGLQAYSDSESESD